MALLLRIGLRVAQQCPLYPRILCHGELANLRFQTSDLHRLILKRILALVHTFGRVLSHFANQVLQAAPFVLCWR